MAPVDPNTLWGATPVRQTLNTQTGAITSSPGTSGTQPTVTPQPPAPVPTAPAPAPVAPPKTPPLSNPNPTSGGDERAVASAPLNGNDLGVANQRAVSNVPTPTPPKPTPTPAPAPTIPAPAIKASANGQTTFTDSRGRTQTGTVVANADGTFSVTDANGITRTANPKTDAERQMLKQGATNLTQFNASKTLGTNATNAGTAVNTATNALNEGLTAAQGYKSKIASTTADLQTQNETAYGTEAGRKEAEATTAKDLADQQANASFQQSRDSLNNTILRTQNNVRLLKGQGNTLFGGAATSSAHVEGLAQTVNESMGLLSDLHDMQNNADKTFSIQGQQRANQLASQIQDYTDNINKNVSGAVQQQLVALGKLQSSGSLTSPEAVAKFDQDSIKALQDVYQQQITSTIPQLQESLKTAQGLYADAQSQLKIDPNTTKTMNDGYLYNANGTRMTDASGNFLQQNVPGDIVGQPQEGPDGNMYAMVRNPVTGVMSTTQISGANKTIPVSETDKASYAQSIATGGKVDLSAMSPADQMDIQTRSIAIQNQTNSAVIQPLTTDVVNGLATSISQGDPNATSMLSRLSPAQYQQVMQGYATMTHSPTVAGYQDVLQSNPDGTQSVVRQGYDKFGNVAGPSVQIPRKVRGTYQNALNNTGETGTLVQYDDGTTQFITASKSLIHAVVKNADGTTSEVVHDPNNGTSYTIPGGDGTTSGTTSGTTGGHDLSSMAEDPAIKNARAGVAFANNNPGNITDTSWGGTSGGRNGFTKFDTVEDGVKALFNKLDYNKSNGVNGVNNGSSYNGNMTLSQYFAKYAPSSDGNDPVAYAQSVASAAGVSVDTAIKDVDTGAMAMAIMQHENGPMAKQLASIGIITPEGINRDALNVSNAPASNLTPDQQNIVNGLKKYTADPAILSRLAGPDKMKILGAAFGDQNYDMIGYKKKADYVKLWNNGIQNTNKVAIKTALGHFDSLYNMVDNLGNYGTPAVNTVGNAIGNAFGTEGSQKRMAFDSEKDAAMTELAKTLKGGNAAAGEQESKNWEDKLNDSQTPGQMKSVIKQIITSVIKSRFDAMSDDYLGVMGNTPIEAGDPIFTGAKTIINKYEGNASTSFAPSSTGSTTSTTSSGATINNSMSAEDLAKRFAPKQ